MCVCSYSSHTHSQLFCVVAFISLGLLQMNSNEMISVPKTQKRRKRGRHTHTHTHTHPSSINSIKQMKPRNSCGRRGRRVMNMTIINCARQSVCTHLNIMQTPKVFRLLFGWSLPTHTRTLAHPLPHTKAKQKVSFHLVLTSL